MKDRAHIIEKVIHLVWSSLESHLPYTYEDKDNPEGKPFHKRCVKEYAELIKLVSELY